MLIILTLLYITFLVLIYLVTRSLYLLIAFIPSLLPSLVATILISFSMSLILKYNWPTTLCWGFPGGAAGKESACQCGGHKRRGFNPWVGKTPWRRAWQPTLVFLSEEPHGQRRELRPRLCGQLVLVLITNFLGQVSQPLCASVSLHVKWGW